MPVHHIKLPSFINAETDEENKECVYYAVENPGTNACLLHGAKIHEQKSQFPNNR